MANELTARVWFEPQAEPEWPFGAWCYEVKDTSGILWDTDVFSTELGAQAGCESALTACRKLASEGFRHPQADRDNGEGMWLEDIACPEQEVPL